MLPFSLTDASAAFNGNVLASPRNVHVCSQIRSTELQQYWIISERQQGSQRDWRAGSEGACLGAGAA
jgi:hypothetical protein